MEKELKNLLKILKENNFPMDRATKIEFYWEKILDSKAFPKIIIEFATGPDSKWTVENTK